MIFNDYSIFMIVKRVSSTIWWFSAANDEKKAEKKKGGGSWKGKRLGAYKGKDGEKEINENRRNEYDFVSRFILNMHRDALANRSIETCTFIRKNVRITYFYRAPETICHNCNSSSIKNNSLN